MLKRNNGRPSRSGQVQIQSVLRKHFERNLSAAYTAQITGFNIKTVCKYFDEWADQINQAEQQDFVSREKKERLHIILGYDNLIYENYELLDEIKEQIKKFRKDAKAVPRYLIASYIEILKSISSLYEKKGSFSLNMPIDESVKKMVREEIQLATAK